MSFRTSRGSSSVVRHFLALGFVLCAFTGSARAQTWNVQTDWSNTLNPNGVWSYFVDGPLGVAGTRGGDGFDAPGPPPIWGNLTEGSFFGWSQSNGSQSSYLDLAVGDIYGHDGPGQPIAIDWTSPIAGTVQLTGAVWNLRNSGRANDWTVTLNGTTVEASGVLPGGSQFSRNAPDPFGATIAVNPGDIIQLSLASEGTGDYAGIDFTVTNLTATPEPASGALLALGLGALAMVQSRRRRHHSMVTR